MLLAYGGPQECFEQIQWPHKVFLPDSRLRGPTDQQNYACWLKAALNWSDNSERSFDAAFFTETDHPMLRSGYGGELMQILNSTSYNFLGKWCSNREGSNSFFFLRHRDDKSLQTLLRRLSGTNDSPIYECLATGMLFRWPVLKAVVDADIDLPIFTEVIVPSAVRALGFQPGCFDQVCNFMRHVRYRPEYVLPDLSDLKSRGAWCCHPLKSVVPLEA